MQIVRRADMDRLDVPIGKHLPVVAIVSLDAERSRLRLSRLFIDIRQRNYIYSPQPPQCFNMCRPDKSCPYNANIYPAHIPP
jgi:hypothetical protein